MQKHFERLLIALAVSIAMAGITLAIAGASAVAPAEEVQFTSDCAACHTEFQMTWQNGAHGQAASNSVFMGEWNAQGNPSACLVCHTTGYDLATGTYKAEGVTCEACHGPASSSHPKTPMPVNRSPELCGTCHTDTRFGWNQYQGSAHYQSGMDCATCHDPHSTTLKDVNTQGTVDGSALCINCHKEYETGFAESPHHAQGLACADCHITATTEIDRPAHTIPDHSFKVQIDTCNQCHADQMHNPVTDAHAAEGSDVKLASLSPEPDPVSPVGFSLMAGLIGLAVGMVLAPWLEKWLHNQIHKGQEQDHD